MKLCKDCKWFGRKWFTMKQHQYCNNPKVIEEKYDEIDGKVFANIARQYGPCFKEGSFWEPIQ